MELKADEIETLRRSVGHHHLLCVRSDEAPYCSCGRDESLAILDRLSPPAPEVDEATVWTRKVLMARAGGFSSDTEWQSAAVCQVLSELIASKDAEIELERGRFKIADEEVDNLRRELVAVRAEKADFLWRRRAEKAESELAAMQAENERLKDTLNTLGTRWALRKAAERNPAEQCDKGFDQGSLRPADTAPVIEATEVDAVLVDSLLSYCDSYKLATWSPLYHEVATFRTEAEARGRLEALEEIKKWLRSPEGKGSDAGIDYADGFADQIERMMTGGK